MSAPTPEVTVVIPTRDRRDFLTDAVRSALAQESVELEVIVVDDASSDGTAERLAAIGDDRLRVMTLESSRGMAQARNAAIAAARGAWIALLDDDDLWAPEKLRRQLDAAHAADAAWVFCDVLVISPDGDVVRVDVPRDRSEMLKRLLRNNVVQAGNSTVLVKTELLRRVGAYEEGVNSPWGLWIRLAALEAPAVVPEPLVAYRRHASSFISRNRRRALAEARLLQRRHVALSRQYGQELDLAGLELWLRSEEVRAVRRAALVAYEDGRRLRAAGLQLQVVGKTRARVDVRRLLRIVVGERLRGRVREVFPAVSAARDPGPAWLLPYIEPRR